MAAADGYCVVWTSGHMDGEVPRVTGDISTKALADSHAANIRLHHNTSRVLWVGTMADFISLFEDYGRLAEETPR